MSEKNIISKIFGPIAQGVIEMFKRDSGPSESLGTQSRLNGVGLSTDRERRITFTPKGMHFDK